MSARQALATLLAVVAALAAVGGAAAWLLRDAVVERRGFTDRALQTLEHEPVRRAVGDELTAQVLARLPDGVVPADQVAAAVDRAIDTRAFRRAFRRGAADVHDALFTGGDGTTTLRIDLAGVLAELDPRLAAIAPAAGDGRLITVSTDRLPIETARAGDLLRTLAGVLPPLACFALAAALVVATDRRRALLAAALTAMVAGGVLLVALLLARWRAIDDARAVEGLGQGAARDAVGAVWDVYAGGLWTTSLVALGAGLVVGLLTLVPWSRSPRRAGRPPSPPRFRS